MRRPGSARLILSQLPDVVSMQKVVVVFVDQATRCLPGLFLLDMMPQRKNCCVVGENASSSSAIFYENVPQLLKTAASGTTAWE